MSRIILHHLSIVDRSTESWSSSWVFVQDCLSLYFESTLGHANTSDRKRPFFTIFHPFGSDSITVLFYCAVNDQILDFRPFLNAYDASENGSNTIITNRAKYGPFTTVTLWFTAEYDPCTATVSLDLGLDFGELYSSYFRTKRLCDSTVHVLMNL